jgi:Nif-specific regulatory protein
MLNESGRLAENQRTLLATMPEMVLVINADGSIEYMNPAAASYFKNNESLLCNTKNSNQLQGTLFSLLRDKNTAEPQEITINKDLFQCHIAPFAGYKGDTLFWVILKTLSETKTNQKNSARVQVSENCFIGSSEIVQKLQHMTARVGKTDATVLVSGESGTGKELIANLLQQNSSRKDKPFLTINCNTINDLLLESDLFGYEKGAFTGADATTKGKFEVVNGGTVFLDEIGDISPRMQAVLLRVLQNGEIIRVGGTIPLKVNIRIIAATNRDLIKAVQDHSFRLDLFYRLSIIKIIIPPLRDRKEDLLELTTHFVEKYSSLFGITIDFNPDTILERLKAHDWPGNVRELENVIQRAILMSEDGTLSADTLSFDTSLEDEQPTSSLSSVITKNFNGTPLKSIVDQIEKEIIIDKLSKNGGNVATTAEKLDICKAALYEKMKRHDISAKALR